MGGGYSISLREDGGHRRVNVTPRDYITFAVAMVVIVLFMHTGELS